MADDLVLDDVVDSGKDTLDLLNEASDKKQKDDTDKNNKTDDEDTEEKEDDKDEDDDKDEKDEEEIDLEDDEEEPTEEEDEDEEIFSNVPSRKEVLKAYPDLYKKFPALEKAVYREQQYAEVFPTVKDAIAVREELGNFKELEAALVNEGDVSGLFDNLKKNAPESYEKITNNLLVTLKETDEKSYNRVINQVTKGTLLNAFAYAKENGDENLEKAAQILHRALYGTAKITPFASEDVKLEKKEDKKDTKLDDERRKFFEERQYSAENEVGDRLVNRIKSTIDKRIDPKNSMSDYVRDKAKADVEREVQKAIINDRRLRMYINRLWQQSIASGYSQSSKDKILNVLTKKAGNVLPSILNKVRNDALKGTKRREREDNEEAPVARGRNVGHKDSDNNPGRGSKEKRISELAKSGMSTLDILNSR